MPDTSSPDLAQLRAEHEALELRLAVREKQAALAVLERGRIDDIRESYSAAQNYVDPCEWFTDDLGRPLWGWPGGPPHTGDTTGTGPLDSEHALAAVRDRARRLCAASSVAAGVLDKLTDYCVGAGFQYRVQARRGIGRQSHEDRNHGGRTDRARTLASPAIQDPARLAAAANAILEEFFHDNRWRGGLDREIFRRSRRDGEVFLALFPQPGGRMQLRLLEPEQVTEPRSPRAIEDWLGWERPSSWEQGIHADSTDIENIHGYFVQWTDREGDFDYLPAARVEHIKLNADRRSRRGVSDFLPVLPWIERAESLMANIAEGAAIQAAIAYIKEHAPGITLSQAESARLVKSEATYRTPSARTPLATGGRVHHVRRFDPGTVLETPHGAQYKPGPLGSSHAPNFIAVEQALLRMIGNRWAMPEYMVSGDASNANYSSTLVAESPFVKGCQAKQALYVRHFERLLWRVLEHAAAAGRFEPGRSSEVGRRPREAGFTPANHSAKQPAINDRRAVNNAWPGASILRQLLTISIEPPQLVVRDPEKATAIRRTLHQAGVLSKATWAAQEGLDLEQERQQDVGG